MEPQFYQTGHSKGFGQLDPCGKKNKRIFWFQIKVLPRRCSVQKKELKTHIIYTCTTACIENVCTRGRDGLPARWELLAHEMLGVRRGWWWSPKQAARRLEAKRSRGGTPGRDCSAGSDPRHRNGVGGMGGQSSRRWHAGTPEPEGAGGLPVPLQTAWG